MLYSTRQEARTRGKLAPMKGARNATTRNLALSIASSSDSKDFATFSAIEYTIIKRLWIDETR